MSRHAYPPWANGVAYAVAVVLIVAAATFGLGAAGSDGQVDVTATFDRVTGLVANGNVTMDGARVGRIAAIDPSPDGRRAVVTLEFDTALDLRSDASAGVHIKSLLGEMYVEVDAGTSEEPLRNGVIANTESSLSVDDLVQTLGSFLVEITGSESTFELLATVELLASSTKPDLDAIVTSAGQLVDSLSSRTDAVNRIVANLDLLTSALDGSTSGLGTVMTEAAGALSVLRGHLEGNVAALESAVDTLHNTLSVIDASKVSDAIATVPDWLTKIDDVVTLISDLANGEISLTGEFAALPDNTASADAQMAQIAQNPLMREFLIESLEQILNG